MNTHNDAINVLDSTLDCLPKHFQISNFKRVDFVKHSTKISSDFSHPNKTIVDNPAQELPKGPSKIPVKETILGWWSGTIVNIDSKKDNVQVEMKDVNNIKIYDSIKLEKFADYGVDTTSLIAGMMFTFSSIKKTVDGENSYYINLNIVAPHVWKESDNKKSENMKKFIFEQ